MAFLSRVSRISAKGFTPGFTASGPGYGRLVTRIPRNALEDGFHHSYARGVPNQAIYLDRLDYEAFMWMLRRTERRFGWKIYIACLMPNHYHLVTEGTVDVLSRGMHWPWSICRL